MYTLVIHGGAGALSREAMTEAIEGSFRNGLEEALEAGRDILGSGGTSLDAVEAALRAMEDNPLFNAGRGSNFTREGRIEMDASIMEGAGLRAGAVATVSGVKNPISLARRILEQGDHVLLSGDGARCFARECGLPEAGETYFHTDFRWEAMLRERERSEGSLSEDVLPENNPDDNPLTKRFGTVGAVALDEAGNLAAATSTGGTTAKSPGRVGDSALIGSGTYANNATCAVSATGHGEYFIRNVTAHEVSALMAHAGLSLREAADRVVNGQLAAFGGRGGVVAVDARGAIAMPFNTPGMYHGYVTS
ncbi:MAG TPA: isoaspartyl peptidase/L-asparaginase, partial [Oceanipulchritudo sp.]|nr:isoaspartyl peptidase/L-asparaginase [Oceanipulchritudo sp.]